MKHIIDLRNDFPGARDQGPRGTCVAFAVTACHEYRRNHDVELSEEFLYGCCKIKENNSNEGTRVDIALNVLKKLGQVESCDMPYNPSFNLGYFRRNLSSLSFFRKAYNKRIGHYTDVIPNKETIEKLIKSEKPIIAVIVVQENFFNPVNYYIDVPLIDSFRGMHAILLVGYGTDKNKPYFIIRNSWGRNWGIDGYAYLSYDYFFKYQQSVWMIN